MNKEENIKILEESNALLTGHFKLASGKHSNRYVQCAKLYENPAIFHKLTKKIANMWKNTKIDRVIGPAMGAVVLAYELAYHLKTKFSFAERRDKVLQLRRNFQIEKGENILLCEDVITTGGTLMELIQLLKNYQVKIVGVTSIINRSNKEYFNSLHFKSLIKLDFKTYEADECPMCKENIPITIPGIKAK